MEGNKKYLSVGELIQILMSFDKNMPVLGHNINDLFVAKELYVENIRTGYYTDYLSLGKKGSKVFVCNLSTDTEEYNNLDPHICLFIG